MDKIQLYSEVVAKDMSQFGVCVIDDFMGSITGDQVLTEVLQLYLKGTFKAGQVANDTICSSQAIRGDYVHWLLGVEPNCANIGRVLQTFDAIMLTCGRIDIANNEFSKYSIHSRTRAMASCYPGNKSGYKLHYDNPNNDGRIVTCLYYLNKYYDQSDGGILRIEPQMANKFEARIEPKFDRAVFFWADRRNPHEVMPTERFRFAISIWYYNDCENASLTDRQMI